MGPRTFVSFDYDNDENEKNLFIGQSKNSRTPFEITDWSSKSSLPQSQWERLVKDKINRCSLMIVLVGQSMRSAVGVEKEINMAQQQDVPFFGVYVDGANQYCALPYGLKENRIIHWNWNNIANAIDQMMTEGKNR
ncbi:MAG: TIR domain-containing protein [Bdellovibrionales bacterium]|nr:TIR domain-containing protein [Bdellovibrionales bacterium]